MSNLKTGGELLARTLKAAGVSKIFALHGGHLEAFYRGCIDHDLELVDFRHEAAAGHAADAYARVTGKLGVCVITAGPGFANAMSAIVNANLDASPTLFIIGAPPLREAETNPLQGGFDQIAMATPATKWAHRITNTERIPDLTAMAIRKATTGRPGAVVLELPIDVLHMSVEDADATPPNGLHVRPRPAPSRAETQACLTLLAGAERPVIIVGGGARFADCGEALALFAERSGIPVCANSRGTGLLPAGHPLDAGDPGNLAILPLMGRPAPDVVLLLGARMGLYLAGRSGQVVPHEAKVIQVYGDAGEIGRIRDIDVAVAADCGSFLDALLEHSRGTFWSQTDAWAQEVTSLKSFGAAMYPEQEGPGGIHPYHAAAAVVAAAGKDAIFALDGGEVPSWVAGHVQATAPGQVLTHGYLGCLGIGPGFAIGAQVAAPQARVIHVTGDGAMGFHIQEFDTMMRWGFPVVTVVLNNRVWGMSIHGQQIMFGANYSLITRLGSTSYAAIARGFGCHGETVTRHEDIAPAMARAFATGKAACVEIMTDPDVVHPLTVNMLGATTAGRPEIMIPYYENIPVRAAVGSETP
ncbi:thiamine pyrophosphate-binding protein [Oleomonas cavernae]|uniref:Thiamine pyrophosphate-binding protein n=1 Tax=Oleomonas cavernae TaxID=2320859 RepID=A0A418WST6_9PROT|nr:thiamine pyrophosphate-binding protein [Oleomonas cavernae]RJF94323.1 thiamine pyrophosphate-binding protein [Oleomonas cavernae]